MVFSHITDFLKLKSEEAGLGFWSEQAFESCHHDFKVLIFSSIFITICMFFRLNGRKTKLMQAIQSLVQS